VELSVLSAVTELMLCVEYDFNNIGLYIIRLFTYVHLRAHDLPNNLYLPNFTVSYPADHILDISMKPSDLTYVDSLINLGF
jgi:hypothetical protein